MQFCFLSIINYFFYFIIFVLFSKIISYQTSHIYKLWYLRLTYFKISSIPDPEYSHDQNM